MTNNRTNNRNDNRNNRYNYRATERARAVTRAKAKKQHIVLATIAIALVAITASGFLVFAAVNSNTHLFGAAPNAVTTQLETVKKENNPAAAPAASTQNTQAAFQQTAAKQQANQTQAAVQQNTQSQPQQNTQTQQTAPTQAQQQPKDRIDNINGERVYIDTKRQAPANSGTPAHYYANGKTSYGFDWTYNADNSNFVIRCDYNFNQQQYDFQFYGTAAGTSHVTLYYNTDDNVQVPVSLTVNVDEALNVTIG